MIHDTVRILFFFSSQEDEEIEWKELKAEIFATVMDFFATGLPIMTHDKAPSDTGTQHNSRAYKCSSARMDLWANILAMEYPFPYF